MQKRFDLPERSRKRNLPISRDLIRDAAFGICKKTQPLLYEEER